jgi:hypothetical protein
MHELLMTGKVNAINFAHPPNMGMMTSNQTYALINLFGAKSRAVYTHIYV